MHVQLRLLAALRYNEDLILQSSYVVIDGMPENWDPGPQWGPSRTTRVPVFRFF